jgi:hypothetical protein
LNYSKRIGSVIILLALSIIGVSVQAQRRPNRVSDRQVSGILQRLERSSSRFRGTLDTALDRSRFDGTRAEDDLNSMARDFDNATSQLKDRFGQRRAVAADIDNVLQRAAPINDFMNRNGINAQTRNAWTSVRTDLNALANAYSVSWQWNRQTLPPVSTSQSPRLSDSQLSQLIRRIETGGNTFRSSLQNAFAQRRYDRTGSESQVNDAVREFKNATDQLRTRFNTRQSGAADVERLLEHATPIDTYMRSNRLTNRAENDWSTLRADLNTLADAYNLSANWNGAATRTGYNSDSPLTGTFRLDSSRSENPRNIADRATRALSNNERQTVNNRLLARLESPEMLAIERRGSTIMIASSRAPQSTFEADGVERQEDFNGRSSRVTATLQGDRLGVTATGYTENDFNVTFESIDNGSRLRVRREIYSERLNQPVVVNSVYNRASDAAQWNVFDSSSPVLGDRGATSGNFLMRDGENVVAVLNNDLTTKEAKQGDQFALTVREPGQYQDAVIQGTVGSVDQGGRLTGRSGISLNFDTIRLRNGQTYRFAGVLTGVRTLNDDSVKVDNEGSAQGDNQTTQTIQRAGIGTAIGAIIGAVVGGAKGAVIGGVIGATGGAGSVYVQDKDHLELPRGTELTIRASAPGR